MERCQQVPCLCSDRPLRDRFVGKSVLVSSQVLISIPYLGKTTFLYWLLLHRLENQLPTAVQTSSKEYFIFDEQGATCHPTRYKDSRLEKCWALVDSNAKVHQPCDCFLNTAYRVIQASSPKPQRWKGWIKQKRGKRITSDLPSVSEIAAIVSVGLVLICWISLLTKRLYCTGKSSGTIHLPLSPLYASGDHVLGISFAAWKLNSTTSRIPSKRMYEWLWSLYAKIQGLSSVHQFTKLICQSKALALCSFAGNRRHWVGTWRTWRKA